MEFRLLVSMVREVNNHGKVYIIEGSAEYKASDVMNSLNYRKEYIRDVDKFIGIEEDS